MRVTFLFNNHCRLVKIAENLGELFFYLPFVHVSARATLCTHVITTTVYVLFCLLQR